MRAVASVSFAEQTSERVDSCRDNFCVARFELEVLHVSPARDSERDLARTSATQATTPENILTGSAEKYFIL